MPAYESSNLLATAPAQTNVSSAYKTMLELYTVTGTLRRGAIFEIGCGVDTAPVNNILNWDLSYITATGTGVAGAGNTPLDPADVVALCLSKMNDTVEPTYTSNSSRWNKPLNQQVSFVWNAAGAASMLRFAAVNGNGLALRVKAPTYASTVVCNFKYEE